MISWVYSKIIKENLEHLEYVLSKFCENKLFANMAKSEFAQEKMDFFKHILSKEGVKPNLKKLQAIRYWKRPIIIKGV